MCGIWECAAAATGKGMKYCHLLVNISMMRMNGSEGKAPKQPQRQTIGVI
jgi:hypothetical protein